MARNWAPGDVKVYRTTIVTKVFDRNPDFIRTQYGYNSEGRLVSIEADNGDTPEFIDTGKTRTEYFGPYRTKGPANAAITKAVTGWYKDRIVSAVVEEGTIIWEEVRDE